MIPEKLVEFIHGNTFIYIGARNEKLQTTCNRVLGAKVNPDGDSFTCFIPKAAADKLVSYLEACNKYVVAMATLPSYEAYQFKGTCTSIRDADNGELAQAQAYLDKMVAFTSQFGIPEEFFGSFAVDPSIAATIKVEEIYDQTPGPGAGKLIFPN
jgi:hypothetical protein